MNEANAAPADPLIGSRIDGRYTVRGILGRGGMGVVYDGVHDELGRSVAIKVLNTAWASDRTAVERFLREARTASSFSHGNIVDVSDLGRLQDGRPYLVMPKITGTDLTTLLAEMGPQPAKRVADLLVGVASALDLIHAKGYVHRDIKPENLMYVVREDSSETVMLLDFGIAKLVMSTEPRLTGQGAVFGTPHFMAPEAWGGGAPNASGDVYALATVVFELITGSLPFESENVVQLLTMKIGRDAPTLTSVSGREFPTELEAVMARALARKPALRFASASDFVTSLKAATHYAPVSWRPGVLRSSRYSGQHMVERQHTSSIHVQDDAYAQAEHEDGYEEVAYELDDETTRDTQRSLPGRRTSEAQAAWTSAELEHFQSPYRMTPRPQYRRNPWPSYIALSAVAAALVAVGVHLAGTNESSTTRNAASVATASASAPPSAATDVAAPSVPPQPTAAAEPASAPSAAAAPAAVAERERESTTPVTTPSAETTAPHVPAAMAPQPKAAAAHEPKAAAAHEPKAAAANEPATHPPLPAASRAAAPKTRVSEAPAGKEPRAAGLALAQPAPFAPEPVDEGQHAPPATPAVLIVRQDTSEPATQAPEHNSLHAKQLTQQGTSALLRGEVGRAVELLNQATDADPTQAAAWRTLGVAFERAGSSLSALDAYRHYLRLAPSGPQAEMVRERMQALEK